MAIDSVGSGGPPGGLASLLPITARQPAVGTVNDVANANRSDSAQASATRVDTAAAVAAPNASQSVAPTKSDIEDAVSKVQKVVTSQASNLLFSIDDDSGRTVVKVVDSSTKETIRQIPSEEILSIAKALDKLQGLLLKQTA